MNAAAPLARRLAEEVAAIRDGPLPAPVLARAEILLRDYVGVTLGGAPEASSRALRDGLGTLGFGGTGTVLGTTVHLPAPEAALANGAAAHALEMDDTKLYWLNGNAQDGSALRMEKTGTGAAAIASGLPLPARIAVDDRCVYWVNYAGQVWRVAK